MISQEMFFSLFAKELKTLTASKGVGEADTERIIQIFQEAMKNPYMDERHIYQQIAENDVKSDHDRALPYGD